MNVTGWGRLPIAGAARTIERDWRFDDLPEVIGQEHLLAVGCGRSYGDSCVNSHATQLSTRLLNRLIHFDTECGVLRCEAGVTLDDILHVIVPRGWFLPVLPGTRFVTVGGAVANDVHGKNHQRVGSFGCHVRSLTVLRSDGRRHHCTPYINPELFRATVGGLGLTGMITDAELDLKRISSDQLEVEDIAFSDIAEFAMLSRDSGDWDYTVSWIDASANNNQPGRGIFSRARHARGVGQLSAGNRKPRISVPVAPPFSLVNRWTVDNFNLLYHWLRSRRRGPRMQHYQPFFFPLDAIGNWNRIYGRHGFYQHQSVLPAQGAMAAIEALLQLVNRSGAASFLTVLKEFGDRVSPGLLSFPRPGMTLAIDFPNRGEGTSELLAALDGIVLDYGGALYPAKDARMSAALFAAGYPALESFRAQVDPAFSSTFWRRVN